MENFVRIGGKKDEETEDISEEEMEELMKSKDKNKKSKLKGMI